MARLKSASGTLKGLLDEYGGWLVIMVGGYTLWSFRGVISTAGDTANASAEALLAQAKADLQTKNDKTKVQAAAPGVREFSTGEIATFRQDATSLAAMLGQLPGGGNTWLKEQGSAFTLLKQKYSRLNLYNNAPWKHGTTAAGKATVVPQGAETKDSVKNPYNYKVLIPFYKEVTNQRDMVSDIRTWITSSDRVKLLKWIL